MEVLDIQIATSTVEQEKKKNISYYYNSLGKDYSSFLYLST